jgi:two-component system, chemotaxis family, protein-glutamate methylesterase/glutaminase
MIASGALNKEFINAGQKFPPMVYILYPFACMQNRFFVAGIGSSAGGLDALRDFFLNVDPKSAAAFVVVSHLPREHETKLHTILGGVTSMKAELILEDTAISPNRIYVLPGHLRVKIIHDVLIVRDRGVEEIKNHAIDEFFFSLAKDKGDHGVAIILSGMGKDGAEGANAVHEAGGIVLVQTPASAQYGFMPVAAINADHPAEILTPIQLGEIFSQCIRSKTLSNEMKDKVYRTR